MKRTPEPGLFKPTPSRIEARSDATTRAAREIIDVDVATRAEKTARLRAERLAHEPIEAAMESVASAKTQRRKR